MKRLPIIFGALMVACLLGALSLGTSRNASAQANVPDFLQFGFTQVVGSVTYTPGQTETITAGTQQVVLPADFISKTVKFELLQGDPAFFAVSLPVTDQGRTVIVAWAFRVTDVATSQLVGRFDKAVQWSVNDPRIASGSAVYNTSPANPPVITPNAAPGTISGNTLSHPFTGAGVGWLVLGPPRAATTATPATTATAIPTTAPATAPTTVPTTAPSNAPAEVPTVASLPTMEATETFTPVGMPRTGEPQPGSGMALLALTAIAGAMAGIALRQRRVS